MASSLLELQDLGGFQLKFVSISWVINHMTCYNSSAFNPNMTCGEFGLPIINKNVSENGVKWTHL